MKISAFLLGLMMAPVLITAAPAVTEKWTELPTELAAEVDAYFTNMELAMNNNRIELVMSLYAPNATEEVKIGPGAKFNVAQIRQRREAEIKRYATSGVPAVDRANLRFRPGAGADDFELQYTIYRMGKTGDSKSAIGEIIYQFHRGERGLIVQSMVAQQVNVNGTMRKTPMKPGVLPTEIELTNGVKLHQAVVVQWQQDKVVLKHVAGTDPIRFDRMIPEHRAAFEAQRDSGLEQQGRVYQQSAQADEQRQMVQSIQRRSAQTQQEREEQIAAAIGEHRLLVGMTQDQVRRSWGMPTRTAEVDDTNGRGVLWVYENRGMDDRHNVANAGVGFDGDIAVNLMNVKK
jgi:hypothetical protein